MDIEEIKEIIKSKNISIPEFAQLCGLSPQTIYRYIKGTSDNPTAKSIYKLNKALRAISLGAFKKDNTKTGININMVKMLMELKNITVAQIAQKINVAPVTVYKYLNGSFNPPQRKIKLIANALGVNAADITEKRT